MHAKKVYRKCLLFVGVQNSFCDRKKNKFLLGRLLKKSPKNCCGHQKMIVKKTSIYGYCLISSFLTKSFSFFYDDTSNFMVKQEKGL